MRAAAVLLALLCACRSGPPPASLRDPLAEPELPSGLDVQDRPYPKLTYAPFPGRPSRGELRWDQVVQGQLGSCFFLATLAELVKTRPDFVARRIRDDGNGAYAVTLYRPDGRPVSVEVDDRFPAAASGAPYFGRGLDPAEIRPALFEKAFAKLSGGYSAIDGGDATAAFRALTGAPAREHANRRLSEDSLWRLLASALKGGRPVVASTLDRTELKRASGREDLGGVIDDHVYAVLDLDEEGGRRFVSLYTPLSPADAGCAKDGPRLLKLTLDDFKRDFDSVTIGTFRDGASAAPGL